MAIEYAGIKLLMDGQVGDGPDSPNIRNWVRDHIPMRQHYVAEHGPLMDDWAAFNRREYLEATPELNTLLWPTGASRWSTGWFLGTKSMATSCIDQSWSDGKPATATLKLGDLDAGVDENLHIEAQMILLPPIPLAWISGGEQLYLLPLVDDRYFWRWRDAGSFFDVTVNSEESRVEPPAWKKLYQQIQSALRPANLKHNLDEGPNADVNSFTSGDYPEWCDVDAVTREDVVNGTYRRSIAEVLDLMALNLGRVLVKDFDGTSRLLKWSDSETRHDDNLAKDFDRIAGLDAFSGNSFPSQVVGTYPDELLMVFPRHHQKSGRTIGGSEPWHGITKILHGEESSAIRLVVQNSMQATYDNEGSLSNESALQAVVDAFADDLQTAASKYLDFVLAGICRYDPTGWSDVIEFRCRHDECTTRVRSQPWSWHPRRLNHSGLEDPRPLGTIFEAALTGALTRGSSTTATIYRVSGQTTWESTGDSITVVDANSKITDGVSLDSGNTVTVYADDSAANLGRDNQEVELSRVYVLLSYDCDATT